VRYYGVEIHRVSYSQFVHIYVSISFQTESDAA
jgi:hypothetical protein